MLFRRKIERSCSYCTRGTLLEDGTVLCSIRGYRASDTGCFRFRYDPCKRIPLKAKTPDFSRYTDQDFTL